MRLVTRRRLVRVDTHTLPGGHLVRGDWAVEFHIRGKQSRGGPFEAKQIYRGADIA